MRRTSTVLTAFVALIMVGAGPALADAPVTVPDTTYAIDWTDQMDEGLSWYCGFDVYSSGTVSQVEKVFFDRDGIRVRHEVHAKGHVDTYAPAFGTSLISNWGVHLSERRIGGTVDDWTQTWTGSGWNIHAPGTGGGAVIHDRGRVTLLWQDFDWHLNPPISWAGPRNNHDVLLNNLDVAQTMCDALAAP